VALGDAYIDVHANTTPFRTDLQRLAAESTGGVDRDFEAQGKEFGEALHKGLRGALDGGVDETRRSFRSRLASAFSDVGGDFTSLFSRGLTSPGVIAGLTAIGFGLAPFIVDGLAAGIALLGGTGVLGLGALFVKNDPYVKRFVDSLRKDITDIFTEAAGPLITPFILAINKLSSFFKENLGTFTSIFIAAGAFVDPLVSAITGLVQRALPGFQNMLEHAQPIFEALRQNLPEIGSALGDIFNAIAESAPSIAIGFGLLLKLLSLVLGLFSQIILFSNFIFSGDAGHQIRRFFEDLIPNAVGRAISAIQSFFFQGVAWLTAFRDNAIGRIGDFLNYVRGIPGVILSAVSNFGGLLYNAGASLVQGLINGIASQVSRLRSWMSTLANIIAGFLPGSPAKEGPLSGQGWTKIRGQHAIRDLVEGMRSETPGVTSASNSTAQFMFGATNINFNGPVTEDAGRTAGNAAGMSILNLIAANSSRLAMRMA
jgi:hypothetical protein